ncbi:MAG: hypothetical protein CMI63_09195 [Parvularcula sp.]|nr:hypothetical protein [Parvularcula sp.]
MQAICVSGRKAVFGYCYAVMPYSVFTYGSGRTGSTPVTALRPTPPDRKPAGGLSREDDIQSGAAAREARDAKQREAENARIETQARNDREQAKRAAEQKANAERANAQKNADRAQTPEQNDAARAREEATEASKKDVKAPPEPRPEDIKRLEQIRAEALYPSPPSAESREIAQLAHTELIRAEAELRAYEQEKARQKTREQAIARFTADQAAQAYRALEDYSDEEFGRLQ